LKAVLFRSTRHDRKKAVAVVEDAPVVADGDFLADEGDVELLVVPVAHALSVHAELFQIGNGLSASSKRSP